MDVSNGTTIIALVAIIPLAYYLILPSILDLLTPKPLPGIPYRKGRQYPLIGDGLDAGKWLAAQTTITQWLDGCAKAFIYGGKELGAEWGVLNGSKSPKEQLAELERPDRKRSSDYEGISQLMFGLGHGSRQVIVTDIEEIHSILTKRTSEFERADVTLNVFRGILPLGQIALKTDSTWKHHRRALGPTMTSKNLKMFHPRAVEAANDLVKLWSLKSPKLGPGQFFEASDDLMYFSTDAITDIAFGKSFALLPEYIKTISQTPPTTDPAVEQAVVFPYNANAIYHAAEYLLSTLPLFSAFPRLSIIIQKFQPTFRRNLAAVHDFIDEQIKEGRARNQARGEEKAELAASAIDMALLKDGTVDALSDAELRDEAFLFLAAGQETTARTLSWGVKRLARSPRVQESLRKELMDAGLHEREMTFDDLAAEKVPYLEATAHEILRLAGTAAGVSRQATKDTIVLGKAIPKGTTLYFPLAMVATMPMEDIAATPTSANDVQAKWRGNTLHLFNPDRWLTRTADSTARALALLELKTMLARMNLAFFLESIPAEYDSDEYVEYVSRKPKSTFVRPVQWKQ